MRARVTIIDDNGNFTKDYIISHSREYNDGVKTKYTFEFEYNVLNEDFIVNNKLAGDDHEKS